MSFICGSCGVAQEAGTKPIKVITEMRKVVYPPVRDKDGNIKYVPEGTEIVKELNVCQSCWTTKEFECNVVDNKMLS